MQNCNRFYFVLTVCVRVCVCVIECVCWCVCVCVSVLASVPHHLMRLTEIEKGGNLGKEDSLRGNPILVPTSDIQSHSTKTIPESTTILLIIFVTKKQKKCLKQWCPTLSPFGTCGKRSFKCVDRQLFRNRFVMRNNFTICNTKWRQ
jgi:hypothetical protein